MVVFSLLTPTRNSPTAWTGQSTPVIPIDVNRRVGFGFDYGIWHHFLGIKSRPCPRDIQPSLFYGITFFTVGHGDLTPETPWAKLGAVVEAGSGLAFLATVIGYLPVLYQLFSRREIQVIMLDARAGSPPTATVLLTRHGHGESMAALQELLHEWESWFALVLESHLSYPMLSYYRSQHDNESWIAGLAAIMDTCALILVGLHEVSTFQARVTFAAARLALMEVNRVLSLSPDVHAESRLTSSEFNEMKAELAAAGLALTDEENAEERPGEFRATYEPFLAGLADHLLLQVPGWVAPKLQLDNWQARPRGRSAKQMVESAPTNPSRSRRLPWYCRNEERSYGDDVPC